MLIADFDATDFSAENPVGAVRANRDRLKSLLARDAHLRTMWFVYTETENGEHYSPRHRHNFDQLRIGLAGVSHYGKHILRERMIGYFPEGTYYGPHTIREVPAKLAAFQFDGPSRSGYVHHTRIEAATRELAQRGEFREGVYYPREGKAQEAYEAALQVVTGKRVAYPKPRFDEPIFMHLDAFPWVSSDESGVAVKRIATFGDANLRLAGTLLDAGATHVVGDDALSVIAFVLDGEATAAGQRLARFSATLVEPGETLAIAGRSGPAELIEIAFR